MTEAEWQECQKPTNRLYSFLQGVDERKRLWFACGCFRQAWHHIQYRATIDAIEAIERYADGAATKEQLLDAAREAEMAARLAPGLSPAYQLAWAVATTADTQQFHDISCKVFWEHETQKPSMFLKDVFGNHRLVIPHRPFTENPLCCYLAEAAYSERILPSGELDPVRLGVLGDAIEELGGYGPILDHLRQPGPHVRGCWAIDTLTAR